MIHNQPKARQLSSDLRDMTMRVALDLDITLTVSPQPDNNANGVACYWPVIDSLVIHGLRCSRKEHPELFKAICAGISHDDMVDKLVADDMNTF